MKALWKLGIAVVATACGGIATGDDEGADAHTEAQAEAASDAPRGEGGPRTCADVGKGPWTDSCCNGRYCNGACETDPSGNVACVCTTFTFGGCPPAAVCCPPEGPGDFNTCRLPADCHSCADVGEGAGVEDCCTRNDGTYICWGRCDGPGGACACGSKQEGCNLGQTCCVLDGGLGCVDGLKCP